jgi:hypothetical protein
MQHPPRLATETPTCTTPAASTFAMHGRSSGREQRGRSDQGRRIALDYSVNVGDSQRMTTALRWPD